MAKQCFLGVDLGAESGRVMAGLFDGRRVELRELHRFPNGPVRVGDTLRWDILRLWSEIQNGLNRAAADYGEQIVSVGVDTWGVDYTLMSDDLELLGHPYHYRDARTQGLMQHTFTRVPREEVFRATGIQFMEINTLYQLVAMRQHHPRVLDLAGVFLMIPDYIHWLLCGSRVVEFTNATTTQCFDPVRRDWARELLQRLEIPTGMFPDVVAPGTKLGTLRESIARETGLSRIDVVAPATHDTGSAVAAVPTRHTGQPRWAYISSGTWSLMGVEVPEAIVTDAALSRNVTNEGGIDGTYRLLKNIMGLWLVQQCRRSFQRRGRDLDYSELTALAADAPPFRSLVDPDAPEFLAPEDMVEAIQQWCRNSGQPVPETEGQLVRCALESLALKYRVVLEWLQELTGQAVEVIHIVGGGSQNRLLNQWTANACGRPVFAGPVEATALGNVLIQARAAGQIASLNELRTVVAESHAIDQFEPAEQEAWAEALERFRTLLPR